MLASPFFIGYSVSTSVKGAGKIIKETYLARHRVAQNSYQRTLHFHDINELLFSLNDGCSFFLDGRTYDIRRGALVLIPEGTIHRKSNPANVTVDTYTLHYPVSLLDAYSTPHTDLTQVYGSIAACIQLPEEKIELAVRLFERCLNVSDTDFGWDLQQNLYFLDILLQMYPLLSASGQDSSVQAESSPLVAHLLEYIGLHLTQRLTLDEMAGHFFVSKFNLCRQFKKETGFTIVEYINSSRIRLACKLLRDQEAVGDVGTMAGFFNHSHFIHTFRQYTGVTPRAYADRYKSFTDVPLFSNFSPQESATH